MSTFVVKSCTLPAISLGKKAYTLVQLLEELKHIPEGSLYMHFWGNRLSPRFVYPDYHNDFAIWAHSKIHDNFLAERLSVIDPIDYTNFEELRQVVLKTVEQRMQEIGVDKSVHLVEPFHFVSSKLIIYNTSLSMDDPKQLVSIVPKLAPSSIFYHFIDAKTRTPGKMDDFSTWLMDYQDGYQKMIEQIRSIDASFLSLREIKEKLMNVITESEKVKR